MSEMQMVGARVPKDWHEQIQQIAQATKRKEAEVLREAIAEYLGRIDADSVKDTIADLQDRVVRLERRVRGWG
jgi:RHH-type rel operon transcriptional repressor/antitoxin RelB